MNGGVVIFKAPAEKQNNESDLYETTFLSAGFSVVTIPVLDFEFTNLDLLHEKLKNPEEYSGLLFTSPRTVEAVKLVVNEDQTILKGWSNLDNFVVGDTTEKLVINLGLACKGKEAGNANNLADIMMQSSFSKPFLYPTGSLTKDTLKAKLITGNIEVDMTIVYRTIPHPRLYDNLSKLVRSDQPASPVSFLFFSPSGVQFTVPKLKDLGFDFQFCKLVAMGPSTASAIEEQNLIVHSTAVKPNAEALLDAVLS